MFEFWALLNSCTLINLVAFSLPLRYMLCFDCSVEWIAMLALNWLDMTFRHDIARRLMRNQHGPAEWVYLLSDIAFTDYEGVAWQGWYLHSDYLNARSWLWQEQGWTVQKEVVAIRTVGAEEMCWEPLGKLLPLVPFCWIGTLDTPHEKRLKENDLVLQLQNQWDFLYYSIL